MANVASLVESKFLNGEMLGATPQILTIKTANIEKLGDENVEKVVVEFFEQQKPLACNVTQLRALIGLFGDDTDNWNNRQLMGYGKKLTSGKFAGRWTVELTASPQQQMVQAAQDEKQNQEQVFTV